MWFEIGEIRGNNNCVWESSICFGEFAVRCTLRSGPTTFAVRVCPNRLRHFAMSRLWDECLWEIFLHHLIYLVCNSSLTWRLVFTFCGLGQFKIWDSRFILEFWDIILKIMWNCSRLRRDCMQFTLKHPIWFWHISVVKNLVKLNFNILTKNWFIFKLNHFKK